MPSTDDLDYDLLEQVHDLQEPNPFEGHNMNAELLEGTLKAETEKDYKCALNKYCYYHGVFDLKSIFYVPVILLKDKPISMYLLHLGKTTQWKESQKKPFLAGLKYAVLPYGLPNILDHPEKYPDTTMVLRVFPPIL